MSRVTYTDGTSTAAPHRWQDDALCRELNPELWFSVGISAEAKRQDETAIAWCNRCPVRDQCLQYALEESIEFGVFGGMTEEERRSHRRRQARRRATERGPIERKPPTKFHDNRPDEFVPAQPTQDRLQALTDAGYSARDLAKQLGIGYSTIRQVLGGRQASVTVATERAVKDARLGPAQQAVNA